MNSWIFYLCPVCFAVSPCPDPDHRHAMVWCDAGAPGSARRKPLVNERGQLLTAAPWWFLEATGRLPTVWQPPAAKK